MNSHKIITLSFATVAALGLLSACATSKNSTANKRDINYSLTADIATLNTSTAADVNSIDVLLNVDAGLVRFNQKAEVANDLAKSINISKDGKTYTVELKPNLRWSNGDPLTAHDFVFAWQHAVDPKTASEYAQFLSPVANANEIMAGKKPLSALGIKAESDSKLTISLVAPTPYFEKMMTAPVYYPMNQKVYQKYGKAYGTTSDKTVYDGPYKFVKGSAKGWNGSNKSFSLVKNDNFYDAKNVKSKGVSYQIISNPNTAANLYKAGKLDVAVLSTPSLVQANKNEKGYQVFPTVRVDALEYNQTGSVPALKNEKIRQALNLATNREDLLKVAAPYFKPAKTITPANLDKAPNGQDFSDYAAQAYTYNPKKAAQLFKEELAELHQSSLKLTLEGASDSPIASSTVNYLKTSFEKALPGLTITENLVPSKQRLNDAQNGNFEIILTSWGADYNEPSDFLMNFYTGSSLNNGKFSNSAYDKAWKKAISEPDILNPKALYADYKDAEAALYNQSNLNPIDTQSTPILMNPNLKGVSKVNSSMIYDLRAAYLEK